MSIQRNNEIKQANTTHQQQTLLAEQVLLILIMLQSCYMGSLRNEYKKKIKIILGSSCNTLFAGVYLFDIFVR